MENLTSSDLEAIGQNWLDRQNKLVEYAQKLETPLEKSFKAWDLAHIMAKRVAKIRKLLIEGTPQKSFPPGGVVSSLESMQPGERVIANPNFKSMKDYETTTSTEPVEIVTAPTKSVRIAFLEQQIGRKKREPLKSYQVQMLDSLELKEEVKIFVPKGIGKGKES